MQNFPRSSHAPVNPARGLDTRKSDKGLETRHRPREPSARGLRPREPITRVNSAESSPSVLVVGAGISGLYFAYKLKQVRPDIKCTIVEKHKIGGRAGNEMFEGARVVTGAGIGRRDKDELLFNLCRELGVEIHEFKATKGALGIHAIDMAATMAKLRSEFRAQGYPAIIFKKFAGEVLGDDYKNFLDTSGYTDYEREDCGEVLFHYGMEDNYKPFRAFSVPWGEIVKKLAKIVGPIRHGEVTSIIRKPPNELFAEFTRVARKPGEEFREEFDQIVIATDISCIRKLLDTPVNPARGLGLDTRHRPREPSARGLAVYRHIQGQPFIRVYAKFTKESEATIKTTISGTVSVRRPLQKIIPMSEGVYMIAYSDNASALYLSKFRENTVENRAKFSALLKRATGLKLDIIAIRSYFWEIGTHYYTPMDNAHRQELIQRLRNPVPDIYVIGEAVSENQGWTEGALESALEPLTNFSRSSHAYQA